MLPSIHDKSSYSALILQTALINSSASKKHKSTSKNWYWSSWLHGISLFSLNRKCLNSSLFQFLPKHFFEWLGKKMYSPFKNKQAKNTPQKPFHFAFQKKPVSEISLNIQQHLKTHSRGLFSNPKSI